MFACLLSCKLITLSSRSLSSSLLIFSHIWSLFALSLHVSPPAALVCGVKSWFMWSWSPLKRSIRVFGLSSSSCHDHGAWQLQLSVGASRWHCRTKPRSKPPKQEKQSRRCFRSHSLPPSPRFLGQSLMEARLNRRGRRSQISSNLYSCRHTGRLDRVNTKHQLNLLLLPSPLSKVVDL